MHWHRNADIIMLARNNGYIEHAGEAARYLRRRQHAVIALIRALDAGMKMPP